MRKLVNELMFCSDCKVDQTSKTCDACNFGMEIEKFLNAPNSIYRKIFRESGIVFYHENDSITTTNVDLNAVQISDLKKALKRSQGLEKLKKLGIKDYIIQIVIRNDEISFEWNLIVEIWLPKKTADPAHRFIQP